MRLLVVGRLSGQLASAVKMAMAHGAKVNHVERADQATEQLRRGQGADLLMVDYRLDIASLISANENERITVPVVAFGVDADAREAAAAIKAGAKEFIPLPPDAELIAAVLSAVADDEKPMISADPSMKAVIGLADQVARSEASILITGESGVGKEVIARALHGAKPRDEAAAGRLPHRRQHRHRLMRDGAEQRHRHQAMHHHQDRPEGVDVDPIEDEVRDQAHSSLPSSVHDV